MPTFTDNKYATGFVKPKTTAILFDKILITSDLLEERASHFGYSYIPHEVLLDKSPVRNLLPFRTSHRFGTMHEISHYLKDKDFSFYMMRNEGVDDPFVSNDDIHPSSTGFFHSYLAIRDLDIKQVEFRDESVDYKYSVNRNRGIREIVDRYRFCGINITPVFFSPTEYEKQFQTSTSTVEKHPAVSICLNNLPEIIEENLEWEQVLQIRSDKKSIEKIRRLKNWLNKELLSKSDYDMKSILDEAVSDYEFALRKHGIQTVAGAISTVSAVSISFINTLSQNGSFDVAGLSIASGLTVFVIKSAIDKSEAKRHPIALIYDLMH